MKTSKKTLLFLLILVCSISGVLYGQDDLPIISVLDFSTEAVSESEMKAIISRLSSALFKTKQYTVIDVTQREMLLDEMAFSLSGCSDESCQIEVGKLLSAENIVVGNISLIGKSYSLSTKVLKTESGQTVYTADGFYSNLEDLLMDIDSVALQLAGLEANSLVLNLGEPEKKPWDKKKILPWSVLGGGAVTLLTGGGIFLNGYLLKKDVSDTYTAYKAAESGTEAESLSAWTSYETAFNTAIDKNAEARTITGIILFGVGVIGEVVSIFLFPGDDDESDDTIAFKMGPSEKWATLSFSVQY